MAVSEAEIEAWALAAMRAWVAGDVKAMKKLTQRDFLMLIGSTPPQLLDRPSFLAAMARGFACTRFALREVIARQHRDAAWFVAGAELDLVLERGAWNGAFLVSGLWRQARWPRKWKLADLSLAPLDPDKERAAEIARLQLWK
ncbi:nuclear transport factor 2 family protein [Erythrobacter tepidarius]|uniref:nuclear transport factor 2 family protein n=1 Tax=Erythrobacter tepidarius TaxID=60454 RepID=UPI000A39C481|nr:nuclear transport factor 2 family protein [Erythrobacter tepidarius]